jgi:hypothetical protein
LTGADTTALLVDALDTLVVLALAVMCAAAAPDGVADMDFGEDCGEPTVVDAGPAVSPVPVAVCGLRPPSGGAGSLVRAGDLAAAAG